MPPGSDPDGLCHHHFSRSESAAALREVVQATLNGTCRPDLNRSMRIPKEDGTFRAPRPRNLSARVDRSCSRAFPGPKGPGAAAPDGDPARATPTPPREARLTLFCPVSLPVTVRAAHPAHGPLAETARAPSFPADEKCRNSVEPRFDTVFRLN